MKKHLGKPGVTYTLTTTGSLAQFRMPNRCRVLASMLPERTRQLTDGTRVETIPKTSYNPADNHMGNGVCCRLENRTNAKDHTADQNAHPTA